LYDLLKPRVTKLVVCDPRKNASMREGNQSDKIDARRLAELLRLNHLNPVYHGEHGLRSLKELVRSYLTITKDLVRVMTRVKAIYRSWAIPCSGKQVYAPRHRAEWLGKIGEPGVRRRAEFYYQQLDALRTVRQEVRRELLAESKKHQAPCGIRAYRGESRSDVLGLPHLPREGSDTTTRPPPTVGGDATGSTRTVPSLPGKLSMPDAATNTASHCGTPTSVHASSNRASTARSRPAFAG
jgi:Transposase